MGIFILAISIGIALLLLIGEAVHHVDKHIDALRVEFYEKLDKERKERQECDNNIMLKLHERYDTLVKWMDRMQRQIKPKKDEKNNNHGRV